MDAGTQSELNDLIFRYPMYEITAGQDSGVWSARRRDSADRLTASSASDLRQMMRDDCNARLLADQGFLARLQERSST